MNLFKKKSIANVENQNFAIGFSSTNNQFNFIDELNKAEWSQNPYKHYRGTLAICINKIANFISTLEIEVKNEVDEVVNNQQTQNFFDIIKSPSLRQPTKQQFLFDVAKEYLFNRNVFLLFDTKNNQLTCLNSREVGLNLGSEKALATHEALTDRYYVYTKDRKQLIFKLDVEKECYTGDINNVEHLLFPSEMVFEMENHTTFFSLNIYQKNILHEIYEEVLMEYCIQRLNLTLLNNKQDTNLLLITGKENTFAMAEEQRKELESKIENNIKVEQGKTKAIFSTSPLNVESVPLNNKIYDMQWKDMEVNARKKIYSYFSIPADIDLEQAKFTNNQTSAIRFIEDAIIPKADYIFNFLSRVMQQCGIIDEKLNIKADYLKTTIYKEYNLSIAKQIAPFIMVNEVRKRIGYEEDPLMENVYTSQLTQQQRQEDVGVKEAEEFFK